MLGRCLQCVRASTKSLAQLHAAGLTLQVVPRRWNTVIMERVHPLLPGQDGALPPSDQVNELHKILRDVEIQTYPQDMQCILTDFVDGLGIRGDVVSVKKDTFHMELYPAGLAMYASPDNIQEFEQERKALGIEKAESRLGVLARMAQKELRNLTVDIPMNEKVAWTLTPQHVQVALRIQGVELDEDNIILPEEPITKFQDLSFQVVINKLETVQVQARVVPVQLLFAATH